MRTFIESNEDFFNQLNTFDMAVDTELFYGNKENPQEMEYHKGVFNMTTGKVANVVSKQYRIIQHNDVAKAVYESLNNLGIQVKGILEDRNDVMKLDLVFTNQGVPIKDDAKGIQLGIRVTNSYDKSTSFKLEMFGYRLICSNGMAIGKALGVNEVTFHTGKEKPLEEIKLITEKFVKNMVDSSDFLQIYVNAAIIDSVEWQIVDRLLPKLITVTKHREEIISRLPIGNITRWDLYNAVTNYVTHDEQLKPSVITNLELKSQKILANSFEGLEKLYAEVIL